MVFLAQDLMYLLESHQLRPNLACIMFGMCRMQLYGFKRRDDSFTAEKVLNIQKPATENDALYIRLSQSGVF